MAGAEVSVEQSTSARTPVVALGRVRNVSTTPLGTRHRAGDRRHGEAGLPGRCQLGSRGVLELSDQRCVGEKALLDVAEPRDRSTLGPVEPCTPFTVAVPEEMLADLRDRLDRTRFIDDFPADGDWTYGVSRSYLQELCEYWRTTFDWRAQEALLNSFDQFQVRVDGQPIHFIHARSSNPAALAAAAGPWLAWIDLRVREDHRAAVRRRRRTAGTRPTPSTSWRRPSPATGSRARPSSPAGVRGASPRPSPRSWRASATTATERPAVTGGRSSRPQLARADKGRHLCGLHLTMPLGEPPADDGDEILSEADRRASTTGPPTRPTARSCTCRSTARARTRSPSR